MTERKRAGDREADDERRAWAAHEYRQLQQFRQLTLSEKIAAIEAMAEVARRLSKEGISR